MALNGSKNPEKVGSLYAIDHEFCQQVAHKKTIQKKHLKSNIWRQFSVY